MSIKASKYSKQLKAYEQIISTFGELFKIHHLPEELKAEIKSFHEKLKQYDIKKHESKTILLEGEIITKEKF